MKPTPSSVRVGLILTCMVVSFLSTLRFALTKPNTRSHAGDAATIAQYEQRFAEAKKFLPRSGIIGYLGESGPDELPEYYLSQYALAPLVVEHSPFHALVLGNFHSSNCPAIFSRPANLALVHDFGNGVLLFETVGK